MVFKKTNRSASFPPDHPTEAQRTQSFFAVVVTLCALCLGEKYKDPLLKTY